MIIYFPQIKPILISIGFICIYWYGITYIIGLIISIWYGKKYIKTIKNNKWNNQDIETLIYNSFIGAVIGGRLGYCFFYHNTHVLQNTLYIFQIWNGGMSFHGGLIGIIISIFVSSKKIKKNFFEISDVLSVIAPISLGIGRIGNFINEELWGKVTTYAPISILFKKSKLEDLIFIFENQKYQVLFIKYHNLPRHPSQIYAMILEGIILFLIMNKYQKKYYLKGFISSMFIINYSLLRFLNELFREPDIQIGLFWNVFSMGQIFSIIMCITGIINIIILKNNYKNLN
ncbi:prolipoprotein diacylglyceryl transferase [Buchnera aphidicola]|uniref:prolipoprotein diacylglyceryl transferase n=1 Tax=Buchnera aphidicola TaxID=9 RepID=UPI003463F68D